MRMTGLPIAAAAALILGATIAPTAARAQAADDGGVKPVPRVTGSDPAALAKRVQMLEERVDNMWSIRQGPGVLSLETLDRMATRLLAAEARLAALEKGGGGGSDALAVATSLSLLAATEIEGLAGGRPGLAAPDLHRLRYLVSLCRLTPWPEELVAKARTFADTVHLTLKALSRGDRARADHLSASADIARRNLLAAALGWTARATAVDPAHAHMDHSSRHGGQLGMSGDLHIEVVATGSGDNWTYSVHLSDATRLPMWVEGLMGSVQLWPDEPTRVIVPLHSEGDRLVGKAGVGPGAEPLDVRVSVEGLPRGHVEMDFQVPGRK